MSPQQQNIIEEIKAHAAIINDLVKKLDTPVKPAKRSRGLTPEQLASIKAKFRKSLYKQ